MVQLITRDNRQLFREQLDQMHRDRKRIFVDRLRWDVPVVDGQYEIDQFDTDDAIYLLDLDPERHTHFGSVRLLPSTKPHILGSLFPDLCEDGVPSAEDTWEVTRLCTTPGLRSGVPRQVRSRLAVALVEFALLYGIQRYTCVAEVGWMSQLVAMGWECAPLGLPREVDSEIIGAVAINITPATLQIFRLKSGSRDPVLEIERRAVAA